MTPFRQLVTFYYANDLEQTADFYENRLELPLALDQGSCRIYQVSESGFIGFCRHFEAPPHPEGIIITLVTTQVDEWHQRLLDKGVSIEKAPTLNAKFNIYHCFLRDPNGYLIEIQTFLDADWKN